ncbi:MAG: hypothetical protein L6R39_001637 [Caloplaca ligustica]|nr:MAG: hypothetical protein L6R39_001637 [Caloplaca ligustica]
MCGITASIVLPQRKGDKHPIGRTNGVDSTNGTDHIHGIIGTGHTNDTDGINDTNGINGRADDHTTETLTTQLRASINIINHRGPDESGLWISPDASIGLGHCRLSINDLSPSGSQPLTSDDGQIHAVVNGEIYDYDRLRDLCATEYGYKFNGESDSQLVVALYKIYGAPAFLEHLRGEFAFVLYDSREGSKKVIAGRDRFGIKPLVWTVVGSRLLMAAEAKAFLPMGWEPEWDVGAIVDGGWMMDDRTLFKGVRKILPGHWMEVTEARGVQTRKYWDAEYEDKSKVETRTIDDMVLGVRERLVESIRLRLRADVPVGVYLSGGIDSSAVAGIVTQLARENHVKIGNQAPSTRVACFSVRFPEDSGYNESSVAERTADWLGVEVIKRDVDEASLARDFADTAYHCEHHHFDLNCVAKFALSTLPREHGVKVVLTGEGADEHFAGYSYFTPDFLREPDLSQPDSPLTSNSELRESMYSAVDGEIKALFRNIGATQHEDLPDSEALADANGSVMPATLVLWHPTTQLFAPWVRELEEYDGLDCRDTVMASLAPEARAKMRSLWHPMHSAQYMWNKSSLANVLLSCLGDRTEMAHSVEARTPFLDHHLTEYVNKLPPSVKLAYSPVQNEEQSEQGPLWKNAGSALQSLKEKWILREAVRPYITDELYKRRKNPFLAPTRWPQGGALHRLFQGLLTREAVEALGFLDYAVVEEALERAYSLKGDTEAFRLLVYVGAWVTLRERFGVKKANKDDLVSQGRFRGNQAAAASQSFNDGRYSMK